MSRVKTIARRSFLIGSAAIVGGVAFGIYTTRQPHDNPLLRGLSDDEASFNPWVKISAERITLIAPHTDVGQGARSVQAALIAEELDLDFGQFDVDTGPPAPAYYNAVAATDGAPFRQRDDGFVANTGRGFISTAAKVMGLQITGGSSTVPDSFDKLRTAGAVARETLKIAASRVHKVPVDQLLTESGAVILPDGVAVPYTALAEAAAGTEPVDEVSLRPPSQWRLLGKSMLRSDIPAKSTGTLTFGIDLHRDGMLNATVRFNPRQGGVLNGYNADAAADMPGVKHIVAVSNGVAVVADNTWNAFKAADAINFDWGEAPYPAESADHWAAVEASFSDEFLDREWRHDGDVDDALAAGPVTEALEYRAPYVAHQPLEPLSALILVTDERADIWVAHQFPRQAQDIVADIVGLKRDDVYLHNQFAGGSFGHRLEFENVRYAAEVGVQLKGTAVKLTFSREEDFAHDFLRQIGISRVRGVVNDKRIEAMDIEVATPSVLASQMARAGLPLAGPDAQIPAGIWDTPYAIPNFRVRAYRVPELAPTSSWRAVGASTGGFFLETAIDDLIHAAGGDPLEERLRLCDDPLACRVLEAVADMSGWGSDTADTVGRGIALVYSFGVYVAEVVEVSNGPRGLSIDKAWVATDVGQVLDPVAFDNQVKGGVIWGLGHAMNCEITFTDGRAEQSNYHQHTGMRMHQCPDIEVRSLGTDSKIRGIGEPTVPPAAAALSNAIFAATGQRLREMPFSKFVRFA
ncbi:MAG: molybdopterin cofactor-binding domain-containing protein [Pseudomonadota bacterium]